MEPHINVLKPFHSCDYLLALQFEMARLLFIFYFQSYREVFLYTSVRSIDWNIGKQLHFPEFFLTILKDFLIFRQYYSNNNFLMKF